MLQGRQWADARPRVRRALGLPESGADAIATLRAVTNPMDPSLNRDRLEWVQQHYLGGDGLRNANARLVDAQSTLPLAQVWGGGHVASADGLRFVVPVRSAHAAPNSRYFGMRRGLTYYNFVSDQHTGFHAVIVPGTMRATVITLDTPNHAALL